MRVGFCGLGRLGLPIAAILSQHHKVTGYDPAPDTAERLVGGHPWEQDLDAYLGDIALASNVQGAVIDADVVVVCVQTPHHPELDGTHPDTGIREPFDLTYLEAALTEVAQWTDAPVVVMSTVLPGDCAKLAPLLGGPLIYNPAFPAMGTTIRDVLDPEFVLIGVGDEAMSHVVPDLWGPVYADRPQDWHTVSWETAELAKVSYNTAVTMKLTLANTVAWMADGVGADGGEVMDILKAADRRIVSDAYLTPGMGDGGACHPRDLIAISSLCRDLGVYDIYSALITHREAHSLWVASFAQAAADDTGWPAAILGAEYKPDSVLTDGSPGRLMANQTGWPIVNELPDVPHVLVVAVPHSRYREWDFSGHVVVDPWGFVEGTYTGGHGGTVVRPGRTP